MRPTSFTVSVPGGSDLLAAEKSIVMPPLPTFTVLSLAVSLPSPFVSRNAGVSKVGFVELQDVVVAKAHDNIVAQRTGVVEIEPDSVGTLAEMDLVIALITGDATAGLPAPDGVSADAGLDIYAYQCQSRVDVVAAANLAVTATGYDRNALSRVPVKGEHKPVRAVAATDPDRLKPPNADHLQTVLGWRQWPSVQRIDVQTQLPAEADIEKVLGLATIDAILTIALLPVEAVKALTAEHLVRALACSDVIVAGEAVDRVSLRRAK